MTTLEMKKNGDRSDRPGDRIITGHIALVETEQGIGRDLIIGVDVRRSYGG